MLIIVLVVLGVLTCFSAYLYEMLKKAENRIQILSSQTLALLDTLNTYRQECRQQQYVPKDIEFSPEAMETIMKGPNGVMVEVVQKHAPDFLTVRNIHTNHIVGRVHPNSVEAEAYRNNPDFSIE